MAGVVWDWHTRPKLQVKIVACEWTSICLSFLSQRISFEMEKKSVIKTEHVRKHWV